MYSDSNTVNTNEWKTAGLNGKRDAQLKIYSIDKNKKINNAKIQINKLYNTTVFKNLREALNDCCPLWINHKLLATWLIRATMRDKDTELLLLPQEYLAIFENKSDEYLNDNYTAKNYIDKFSLEVAEVVLTNKGTWNKKQGMARTVDTVKWPEKVRKEIDKNNQRINYKNSVYLISGLNVTRRKRITAMKEMEKDYQSENENINLWNKISPTIFENMCDKEENIKKLIENAEKTEYPEMGKGLVQSILDCPKPFYSDKEITDRFYSDGGSIQNLSKEDRNIFIGESLEIDLVQAQLAIVASKWGATLTNNFLKEGGSIWEIFYQQFPIYEKDFVKKWVKKALYSLCFGAGKELRNKILWNLGSNANEIFHKNIYIADILKSRNKFIQFIKKNKRIKTVQNKWLSTSDLTIPQILALSAQAYEYKLIKPIFELYKKNKKNKHGFELICYEFDGLHLKIKLEEDKKEWINRITEAVNTEASRLEVPTKLEVKEVCTWD